MLQHRNVPPEENPWVLIKQMYRDYRDPVIEFRCRIRIWSVAVKDPRSPNVIASVSIAGRRSGGVEMLKSRWLFLHASNMRDALILPAMASRGRVSGKYLGRGIHSTAQDGTLHPSAILGVPGVD